MNTETSSVTSKDKVPRTTGRFLIFLIKRIKDERKWWLLPFWVLAVVFALVLFLSGSGAMLPAIYLAL